MYDSNSSLLMSNMGSTASVSGLKFEAYKQETPAFVPSQPKETLAGNPVFGN